MSQFLQRAQPDGDLPVAAQASPRAVEAIARVRAQVELALMNPRSIKAATSAALVAMEQPLTAERATYRFPRGREEITGPSVKLARELARCWGNVHHGTRVVSQTANEVHVESFAWDLETGNMSFKEARFNKKIPRKRGDKTVWEEPNERDLDELIARRAAKLERNCLLEILPDDLVDRCLNRAAKTRRQVAAKGDPMVRFERAAKAFAQWGVDRQELLDKVGGSIDVDAIVRIQEIYRSIENNHSTVEEVFGRRRGQDDQDGEAKAPAESLDDLFEKP